MSDHFVKCAECGAEFVLTSRDVTFFASRSLHLPKRCVQCRAARRAQRAAAVQSYDAVAAVREVK